MIRRRWCALGLAGLVIASGLGWRFADRSTEAGRLARAVRGAGLVLPEQTRLSVLPLGSLALCSQRELSDPSAARRELARLELAAERTPTGAGQRLRGALALLRGSPERAVALLQAASEANPRDGALWSDLSAAYAARAAKQDQPLDLVRSLSAAAKGLDLAPESAHVRFTYAEALTGFSLRYQAIPAWESYLELMPSGSDPYAEARLAELRKPTAFEVWPRQREELVAAALAGDETSTAWIVRQHPSGALEEAETKLLAAWAERTLAADEAGAERQLEGARLIAEILARENGDYLLLDEVDLIERKRGEPAALRRLAEGHRAYGVGMGLITKQEYGTSPSFLRSAKRAYVRVGSRYSLRADYLAAFATFYLPDYVATAEALRDLRTRIDTAREPLLAAASARLLALVERQRANFGAALVQYQEATTHFNRARDLEATADIARLEGSVLFELGQDNAAWRSASQAIDAAPRFRTARTLISFFGRLADVLDSREAPEVALRLHSESVAVAHRFGTPLERVVALRSRSQASARSGAAQAAERDLRGAWRAWEEIPDPRLRTIAKAEILRAEGDLPLGPDLEVRLQRQTESLEFFRQTSKATYLPGAYAVRARVNLALGKTDHAERDLRTGIAEVERQRAVLSSDELKIGHFSQRKRMELFDDLVELLVHSGRSTEAFAVAESSRARALIDRFEARRDLQPAVGGDPVSIQQALPEHVTLVCLKVLPQELLVWRITAREVKLFSIEVAEAELRSLVEKFLAVITGKGSDSRLKKVAGTLYGSTLSSVLEDWVPTHTLALIPDGPLLAVPFAALYDEPSGTFLVERSAIVVSPSARAFVAAEASLKARGKRAPRSVLAMGVNSADPVRFPALSSLQFAEAEAASVAAIYRHGLATTGPAATPDRLTNGTHAAEVLHFAGHSIVNEASPALSSLAMRASATRGGALYAHEIAELDLHRTRLVVLSSCDSAAGTHADGEGVLSLARAFLAAGVPSVVASLWELEDGSAQEIFEHIHRKFAAGLSPAEAVRDAQVELLKGRGKASDSPHLWAAITLVGSG